MEKNLALFDRVQRLAKNITYKTWTFVTGVDQEGVYFQICKDDSEDADPRKARIEENFTDEDVTLSIFMLILEIDFAVPK